jgi:hypothetical protein
MLPKKHETYIATIVAAAKTHAGCEPIADKIGNVLRLCFARGIRQPNDWEFHFNGVAQFRWFDGKGYSNSSKNISVMILPSRLELSGRIAKDRYGDSNGIKVEGLTELDATVILSVLVGLVDEKTETKLPN